MDPIGPAPERPLLIREIVPYADRRSSQLQNVLDDLLQQDRLVPGQLERLLRLVGGARSGAGRRPPERSGALEPARAERALADEAWRAQAQESYGARLAATPARGWGGPELELPRLRRFSIDSPAGAVRVHESDAATVLEGDAHGIAALAAHGELPDGALRYAGDLSADELRAELERGGTLVLTDSNRRRVVNSARLRLRYGPTLGPDDDISEDSPTFELFEDASNAQRTVALYSGLSAIESPIQAARRSSPSTACSRPWTATQHRLARGPQPESDRRFLELRFARPLPARFMRFLFPRRRSRGHPVRSGVGERRRRAGGRRAAGPESHRAR